jgi:hypothetical protein
MKNDFNKLINETLIGSKEFSIVINEEKFILNSSTISKFEEFLIKHLKKCYILIRIDLHIETLPVGGKNNAYFPHTKSPLLFSGEWSKLGLPYIIERLK